MRKVMAGLAFGALATGMLVVAAPDEGGAAGVGGRSVSIQHHQFDPRELTISVGDEVTWTHRDGEQVHSVTADDGSFDSNPQCSAVNPKECMSDHDTFKVTFGAEGRYPYFSRTWGGPGGEGASGVIVVMTAPPPAPKKGSPNGSTTSTTAGSATATTATTAPGGPKSPKF
jgi:plastocyanin